MTIAVDDTRIRIEGVARVEDAEPLAAALQTASLRPIDLSACTEIHAAVLQALLVFRPAVIGLQDNVALGAWLAPLLAPDLSTETNR
ncbi:MAG: hypothetical protein ACOH1E_01380 [Brevundimonas sp.]